MPRHEACSARLVVLLALLALGAAVVPVEARAQGAADEDPFDPEGLGSGPYSEMSTLMEVTIFGIDVLTLTVRVPPETGDRLGNLVRSRDYSEELADSVAAVILETHDLWARQVFERDASYDRILDGMAETNRKAVDAGYISESHHRDFVEGLPEMFDFLEERGVEEGDEIFFRIRGDTVRTLYRTSGGDVLMDRTVVDPEARRGSIPGFFAPDTRFRQGLVESLIRSPSIPR